ncbi:hypothetical protein BKA61DRAFT_670221 [Leptodontidium sp. MPI-SDFR-AT-0119]|nr:hypothetical protein BKA61DRAFT_670221 [Leptodontidium sp. MPI-SDFR-AT-0119]
MAVQQQQQQKCRLEIRSYFRQLLQQGDFVDKKAWTFEKWEMRLANGKAVRDNATAAAQAITALAFPILITPIALPSSLQNLKLNDKASDPHAAHQGNYTTQLDGGQYNSADNGFVMGRQDEAAGATKRGHDGEDWAQHGRGLENPEVWESSGVSKTQEHDWRI